MKKIYISGKMTGDYGAENIEKFAKSEHYLREIGYNPVNPLFIKSNGTQWIDYIIADLNELKKCDVIYMQKDWKQSDVARIEHEVAVILGLEIIYE